MLKPWANPFIDSTNWITKGQAAKFVWLEMSTVQQALAEQRIRKLILHTEYGRVTLYHNDEEESYGWILDESESYVVRCRVTWYEHAASTVEAYGPAQC